MPYILIAVVGLLNLLSVKVPEGMDPLFFFGTAALAAIVVTGLIIFILTSKHTDRIMYAMGFVGVGLLLTLAISIMPKP